MHALLKRVSCNPLFVQVAEGLLKRHVNSAINNWCLTQHYAETIQVSATGVPLVRSRLFSNATGESEHTVKQQCCKHRDSTQRRRSWRSSGPSRRSRWSSSRSSNTRSPRNKDQKPRRRRRNPRLLPSELSCFSKHSFPHREAKVWDSSPETVSPINKRNDQEQNYESYFLVDTLS